MAENCRNRNTTLSRLNGKKIGSTSSAHKGIPITEYTNSKGEIYEIREHVYVDVSFSQHGDSTQIPYAIAFIHAFKAKKDGIYMDIRWYYRFNDLPVDLQTQIHPDLTDYNIEYLPKQGSCAGILPIIKDNKSADCPTLFRFKTRELFASEILDSCLASCISGRCCIVSYRTITEAQEFRAFPDTFYYLYTYNPHLRRLASTQGEIRIGPEYQAVIPNFEGPFAGDASDNDIKVILPTKSQRKRQSKTANCKLCTTEREEARWRVDLANRLSPLDFITFLQSVRSIASFSTMCEQTNSNVVTNSSTGSTDFAVQCDHITQRAYDALHDAQYDFKEALENISKSSLVDPIKKAWSEEDQKKFQRAIRQLGKNFYRIQRECLPEKTVSEVVEFYYSWKKTSTGLIMRPKRRIKHALRKVKNSTANNNQSVTSSVNCNDNSSTSPSEEMQPSEDNVDDQQVSLSSRSQITANLCDHCHCTTPDHSPNGIVLNSDTDNKQFCTNCCKHFKRYGQWPNNDSPIAQFDETPLQGRLKEAMSSFQIRETVAHAKETSPKNDSIKSEPYLSPEPHVKNGLANISDSVDESFEHKHHVDNLPLEIKSEAILDIPELINLVFSEKDDFKLIRKWNRIDGNSCSRTDIIYSKKSVDARRQMPNRIADKSLKRTGDIANGKPIISYDQTERHASLPHALQIKDEKRIKNEKTNDRCNVSSSVAVARHASPISFGIPSTNSSNSSFSPYNVPTLNKLFSVAASANIPHNMFQHHPSFSPMLYHHYAQTNSHNTANIAALNSSSHSAFPVQLSNDTPALRQLRDIAAVRSLCHSNLSSAVSTSNQSTSTNMLSSIYNNAGANPSAAFSLQQFMSALNGNVGGASYNMAAPTASGSLPFLLNQQLNGSTSIAGGSTANQRQLAASDYLNEPSIKTYSNNRRHSPASSVPGRDIQHVNAQPSTHNHAHLHAHSHTHLHLNDNVSAGGSSSQGHPHQNQHTSPQPIISPHATASVSPVTANPFLMLPPSLQNSLYYQQLMNHAAFATNNSQNSNLNINDSDSAHTLILPPTHLANQNSLDPIQIMGYAQPGQTTGFHVGSGNSNPFLISNGSHLGFQPNLLSNFNGPSLQTSQNLLAAASQQHQQQALIAMMMRGGIPLDYMPHQYHQALQQQLFFAAAASAASRHASSQFMSSTPVQPPSLGSRVVDLKPNVKEDSTSTTVTRGIPDRNGRSSSSIFSPALTPVTTSSCSVVNPPSHSVKMKSSSNTSQSSSSQQVERSGSRNANEHNDSRQMEL
ncbi:hypothetical protein GJ496_011410 [Pomphorhynchus laevis]|nr:hypothetical protein GJ496_011410 [Pomphorhynchus laevis]